MSGDGGGGDGGCWAEQMEIAMLRAKVARLEAKVAQLERMVEQLKEQIRQLKQVIRVVQAFCLKVMAEAGEILGQSSGVPRGTWSYAKGGRTVAAQVLALLGIGEGVVS